MPSSVKKVSVTACSMSLSLSSSDFSTSWFLFFCVHCSTSSIHAVLGVQLPFLPSNFPSNSSNHEHLKTSPTYASFYCSTMFLVKCKVSCFIFFQTFSIATLFFQLIFIAHHINTTVQKHQLNSNLLSCLCWLRRARWQSAVKGVRSPGDCGGSSHVTVTVGRRCGYLQLDVRLWRTDLLAEPPRCRSVDDERRSGGALTRLHPPCCCCSWWCCCCWWWAWTGVVRWWSLACVCSCAARLKYASKSSPILVALDVSIT